jgi:mannosyltransferase OCH1-like enzyme
VLRILLLSHYGGIYLDNDVYVVNSLENYRKFEMTLSWDSDNDGIGSQVLIAHKNARFLKTYFDSYRYELSLF